MKTAKEWAQHWYESKKPVSKIIREAQADAIRGAVDAIRNADIYDGDLRQLEPALKLAKQLENVEQP